MARALALYREAGDPPGQVACPQSAWYRPQNGRGLSSCLASHQKALTLARSAGDRLAEADSLNIWGGPSSWPGTTRPRSPPSVRR